MTVEFLGQNAGLVLDTRNFGGEFVAALHEAGVLAQVDGWAIQSENAGGLRTLARKLHRGVRCIYIDPPYNTGSDGFAYKDSYQHSSWLTMIESRLTMGAGLLNNGGLCFASCDRHEHHRFRVVAENVFSAAGFVESFSWIRAQNPSNLSGKTRQMAESVLCYERASDGTPLLGELLDGQDSQPLYNADNAIGALRFPPNSVQFGFETADLAPGEYGKGPICLLEVLTVRSGLNTTPLVLSGPFRWRQETLTAEIAIGTQFRVATKASLQPRFKRPIEANFKTPDNILLNKAVGVGSNEDARDELTALLGSLDFAYPKPVSLVRHLVAMRTTPEGIVLDFFAGSGTTAHAVLNLNRADSGTRRYILIEMADYFDTVLLPRICKVVYSPDWKDGKPTTRDKPISHCLCVQRFESYDDTLDNLELAAPTATTQAALLKDENQTAREAYMLRYQLLFESKSSLLNLRQFAHPFDYTLAVRKKGVQTTVTVDLIATFNYLIGLHESSRNRYNLDGIWFIEGRLHDPDGEGQKVLVVWRDTNKVPNDKLNEWFRMGYDTVKSNQFAAIYVNGDNLLPNVRTTDDLWKVRLIEDEFLAKMFATDDN